MIGFCYFCQGFIRVHSNRIIKLSRNNLFWGSSDCDVSSNCIWIIGWKPVRSTSFLWHRWIRKGLLNMKKYKSWLIEISKDIDMFYFLCMKDIIIWEIIPCLMVDWIEAYSFLRQNLNGLHQLFEVLDWQGELFWKAISRK